MSYRNANYTAFYVDEPFSAGNLGANSAYDFCYYRLLTAWKARDSSFPFIDAHEKTYSVRDGSDWEKTLKPRLHERLEVSKNIILLLSSHTKASRALSEELEYGVAELGLPVIVIYPEFDPQEEPSEEMYSIWRKISFFREYMNMVPSLHLRMDKDLLRLALEDSDYTIQGKRW